MSKPLKSKFSLCLLWQYCQITAKQRYQTIFKITMLLQSLSYTLSKVNIKVGLSGRNMWKHLWWFSIIWWWNKKGEKIYLEKRLDCQSDEDMHMPQDKTWIQAAAMREYFATTLPYHPLILWRTPTCYHMYINGGNCFWWSKNSQCE